MDDVIIDRSEDPLQFYVKVIAICWFMSLNSVTVEKNVKNEEN